MASHRGRSIVPGISPHQPSLTSLRIPADAAYGVVVRGVVSALAALDDPSIDELDDIRLAAQEGFVSMVEGVPDARWLEVQVSRGDDEIRLEFWADGSPTITELSDFSVTVLKTLAEEYACTDDADGRRLVIRMPMRGAR